MVGGTEEKHVDQPGDLVKRILYTTGWTQTRLVYELRMTARSLHEPEPTGLHPVTVNRWYRGRQTPSIYYQRLLQLVHAAIRVDEPDGSAVRQYDGATPPSAQHPDEGDMKRRRFLTYTAALAGGLALDHERLAAVLQRGAGGDDHLLDELATATGGLANRWYVEHPDTLLTAVGEALTALNELRTACSGWALRRRFIRLTSETAALAGWLAWHTGNQQAAHAYYTYADGLAGDASDADVQAFVLVLWSFMRSGLWHRDAPDEELGLAMLHRAVELTERSTSPFLRVFALGRRAEELARTGRGRVEHDLDRAQTILASTRGVDVGFFSYWDEDRLVGCRGTCAMAEQRPLAAIPLLSAVLSTTPQELAAERSILMADLGAAHAMLGEVEHACALLEQSLGVGGEGNANRVERVLAIRAAHLARRSGTPAVRRLDELLRTATP